MSIRFASDERDFVIRTVSWIGYIPKSSQDTAFCVSQGLIIKALLYKQCHSLLKSKHGESKCLENAYWVCVKAIYTALLILTIAPLFFAINALPKSLLIPTTLASSGDLGIISWEEKCDP